METGFGLATWEFLVLLFVSKQRGETDAFSVSEFEGYRCIFMPFCANSSCGCLQRRHLNINGKSAIKLYGGNNKDSPSFLNDQEFALQNSSSAQ